MSRWKISLVLPLLLLAACASAAPIVVTPGARIQGNRVAVRNWPRMTLEVDPAMDYVGSDNFVIYDVASADVQLFVEADAAGTVQRMYWIQIEGYLPDNDHRYDYSQMPYRVRLGDQEYLSDLRYGESYSLDDVPADGDVARVLNLLHAHGYRMPETMIRSRMVRLDDARRRELLIIYMESRDERRPGIREFESSPALWEAEIPRYLDRAVAGLRLIESID